MDARVENLEVQFEERPGVAGMQVAPVWGAVWWKLALAAVLLAIVLALAASALFYSQQDDAPMQVEPKVLMV
jgi:anti-sigma-K factor RskA